MLAYYKFSSKLILMNYFKDLKELDVWKAKTCNFSFEMFP